MKGDLLGEGLSLEGGDGMRKRRKDASQVKEEGRDRLAKAKVLVPFAELLLKILELILRIMKVI